MKTCNICGAEVPEGAGHTHGSDTPEDNEEFWKRAKAYGIDAYNNGVSDAAAKVKNPVLATRILDLLKGKAVPK